MLALVSRAKYQKLQEISKEKSRLIHALIDSNEKLEKDRNELLSICKQLENHILDNVGTDA